MPQASPTIRNEVALRSAALVALLEGLVDYAGLFPPAKLTMQEAVENYATYARDKFRWMLGRFIVPVARLAEFENAITNLAAPHLRWSVSALPGSDVETDIKQVLVFNGRHNSANIAISSIELKVARPDDIDHAHSLIPSNLETFFEIPLSADLKGCIAAIKQCGRSAKIRTGGETAEMIPPSAAVAEFILQCAQSRIAFKATAGLHHPIRSVHPLTYATNSPSGTMHGFLNVFLTAAFLLNSTFHISEAIELLDETSPEAFSANSDSIGWRNYSLTREQLSGARKTFSLSFGSCSFSEPLEDLQSLSLL